MRRKFSGTSSMHSSRNTFFVTVLVIALIVVVCFTGLAIPRFVHIFGLKDIKFGIDIKGGFEAYLEADTEEGVKPSKLELDAAKSVVEKRLDSNGITDREIYIDGSNRIIVRAPLQSAGEEDKTNEIFELLGQMALLTFREPNGTVVLEGKDVRKANVQSDQNTGRPVVSLELTGDGASKFADATGRLIGQPIAIYMDDVKISEPTVRSKITDGKAIIESSNMTTQEAKLLADQIQAGALPFAMKITSKNIVSASLGDRALQTMIQAGIVALILIALFMILYYRLPGLVAVIALIGHLAGQLLAISVPQITLTLPGIAAIILSIGMGVDANVIIAERIKEEVRMGSPLRSSLRNGYDRALSAVIDGNVTVAIAAALLMLLGSGTFKSFGYTLLAGVVLNGIFGIMATRLMNFSLNQYKGTQNTWLYGGKKVKS